jgi:zinc protease
MKTTKMTTKGATLLAGLIVATGCGPSFSKPPVSTPPMTVAFPAESLVAPEPPGTPDEPFRQAAPPASGQIRFTVPEVTRFTLGSGIPVVLAKRDALEIVSLSVVFREPDVAAPGVLAFLGAMLEQGTKSRDAAQISDAFEALGAAHFTSFTVDGGGYTLRVPKQNLKAALAIVKDILQNASFPQDELERLRVRRSTALAQERSSLQAMANNTLSAVVFGRKHPYGHSAYGVEADIAAVRQSDLVTAKAKLFVASKMMVAVAGMTDKQELEPLLADLLGAFPRGQGAAAAAVKPELSSAKLTFVEKADSAQSFIYVAAPGTTKLDADRLPISLLNTMFGGAFSSRVNLNLREKHAYTYGARSRFVSRRWPGLFSVGAAVRADVTGAALKEVLAELKTIRTTEVPQEELDFGKDYLLQSFGAHFETLSDLTEEFGAIYQHRLPEDELSSYGGKLKAVTSKDTLRVAAKFFAEENLRIVVVGDPKKVLPQLAELGLGAPEVRNAFGDLPEGSPAPITPKPATAVKPEAKPSKPGSNPVAAPVLPEAPKK